MFENDYYENEDFSECIMDMERLERKKFVNCKFNTVDFTDIVTIFSCTFDTCDFVSAEFNGVEIRSCAFLSCKFKYANFFATKLDECKMTGSIFTDSDCASATILGGDWAYTELRHIKFSKQEFSGIRFSGADLTGSRFEKCKVENCDFDEAMVRETSFFGSDIRNSSFNNVDFLNMNLKNAKVDLQQCVAIAEAVMAVKYTPEKEDRK